MKKVLMCLIFVLVNYLEINLLLILVKCLGFFVFLFCFYLGKEGFSLEFLKIFLVLIFCEFLNILINLLYCGEGEWFGSLSMDWFTIVNRWII